MGILILKFEKFKFSENNSATKNLSLSVIFSILVHLFVVLILKNLNLTSIPKIVATPIQENYVDLGYEQFDEVPQVVDTKVPEIIKDTPEIIPDKTDPAPSMAQEIQDQGSDIVGLQQEPPKEIAPALVPTNKNISDVPYYKVKPKYPKEALLGGLEGHILLQVDINVDGSVENVKVTGGERVNIFESEARRAVVKWKYKPFTDESGQAIKKEQHQVRVDFKLIDDQAKN